MEGNSNSMNRFRVRPAEPRDCPHIMRLIRELAAYENMPEAVKITETASLWLRDRNSDTWQPVHIYDGRLVPGDHGIPFCDLLTSEVNGESQIHFMIKLNDCSDSLNNGDLLRDGFGTHPFFQCLVAEVSSENVMLDASIVAFAMYYFTYDPWIGKLLYLEDFYVMEEYRGWGIGTELLKNLSQIALESNCSCMHFLVVVWNKPSIEYYMRHGASDLSTEEGWHLFRFDKEHLVRMATGQ